jgi:hypothetical protein
MVLLCCAFTAFAGWIDMKYNSAIKQPVHTNGITDDC